MITFEVDPGGKFKKAIDEAVKEVDDLTIPFALITQSWYKSNQFIFDRSRQSEGKYVDLSEDYKQAKFNKFKFIYPILLATGRLERSMTDADSNESINKVINKKTLILGTRVPYAPHHQFGTSKMPARPFVLIGAEQVAPEGLNRRQDAWVAILASYVAQKSRPVGEPKL